MIVVGTTLAAFVMDQEDSWSSWLKNSDSIKQHAGGVTYFASLEVDARGLQPFKPLLDRLGSVDGTYNSYMYDDGREEINSTNRIKHITMGRNLIHEYALHIGASHILFLDADLEPDPQTLPKLLELNHPIVGGEVSTYCLSGPPVTTYSYPVQQHMNTAGYLLVNYDIFNRIRWRSNLREGLSDDPCFHIDALELLGVPTYVRKDCVGIHYPLRVGPIETRGHDLSVIRNTL